MTRLAGRSGMAGTGAAVIAALAIGCATPAVPRQPDTRPNIVFIMADDLGYGELGSYGQTRIRTPHLDSMAAAGMRFTSFYSGSPVCAPARATLITGLHTGHTFVRGNYGLGEHGDDQERGQLPLKPGTPTIGTMLQAAGYATAAIGKWGLGGAGSTGIPARQGFDFFYGYLDQKQAHNYYPTHLWKGGDPLRWDTLDQAYFAPHQILQGDPNDPSSYAGFSGEEYAPDLMTEEALRFIEEHRDEPFFLYLPYTIPHLALQVPDEELDQYEFAETPYLGRSDASPDRASYLPHPRPRAAYAGMISRLDGYVGEVIATLRELGLDEKTLVIFTSDNGPTNSAGVDHEFFESQGPLRGLKGSLYEGGIRVPMIAAWPGRIAPGSTSDHASALWDVMPTLAELTGAELPGPTDGISFLPTLLGRGDEQRAHQDLYWEHAALCGGQQALRMGRWKGIRLNVLASPSAPLELYDLQTDPGEEHNVAGEHPKIVAEIWERMRRAHTPSEIERWNFTQAETPRAASGTPRAPCFPWEVE